MSSLLYPNLPHYRKAVNSLIRADMPLRNCSLLQSWVMVRQCLEFSVPLVLWDIG